MLVDAFFCAQKVRQTSQLYKNKYIKKGEKNEQSN